MKYYKTENTFGKQYNNIIPDCATEITPEEYTQLETEFKAKQAAIATYAEKVINEEMEMEEVPAEYYEEVYAIANAPKPEPTYTLDEAAQILTEEVANEL